MREKQISKDFKHNSGIELSFHSDRQTFTRELVDDTEHTERLAVMGSIHDEVITPNMICGVVDAGEYKTRHSAIIVCVSVVYPRP